jgi:CheY-like chemotaxis protein
MQGGSSPARCLGSRRRRTRSDQYRRHVDDLGHTGIAASSGKEALEILRQRDPVDLVITDYAMPHMTGLQLADAIKGSGATSGHYRDRLR